jgi:hypothetical protein
MYHPHSIVQLGQRLHPRDCQGLFNPNESCGCEKWDLISCDQISHHQYESWNHYGYGTLENMPETSSGGVITYCRFGRIVVWCDVHFREHKTHTRTIFFVLHCQFIIFNNQTRYNCLILHFVNYYSAIGRHYRIERLRMNCSRWVGESWEVSFFSTAHQLIIGRYKCLQTPLSIVITLRGYDPLLQSSVVSQRLTMVPMATTPHIIRQSISNALGSCSLSGNHLLCAPAYHPILLKSHTQLGKVFHWICTRISMPCTPVPEDRPSLAHNRTEPIFHCPNRFLPWSAHRRNHW